MSTLFSQGGSTAPSSTTGDISKDVEVPQNLLPTDSISALAWSLKNDFLAVAAWDKVVRIYEISGGSVNGKWSIPCSEVPLCVAWSPVRQPPMLKTRTHSNMKGQDGTKVAAGGNQGSIFYADLTAHQAGGEVKPIDGWKPHSEGVKGICFFEAEGKTMLATGSWDKTVQFWDFTSTTACVAGISCAERVYSMDTRANLLVVATAERHIHIINLTKPKEIYKTIQSPLKWQTRVVSCFTDASGFAVGSIEGRCAIQYVDDKDTRYASPPPSS